MNKISDERFAKPSSKYEDEPKETEAKIKELSEEITASKSKTVTSDTISECCWYKRPYLVCI